MVWLQTINDTKYEIVAYIVDVWPWITGIEP